MRKVDVLRAVVIAAVVIGVTTVLPTQAASAASSDWLDPTYGTGGVTTFLGEDGLLPWTSNVDSQDRTYLVSFDATTTRLRRLTADGLVDPAFGGGTMMLPDFSPSAVGLVALHADAGGTVTVAASLSGGGTGVRVSRFTDTGAPDAGFGSGGSAVFLAGTNGLFLVGIAERPGGGLILLLNQQIFPSGGSHLVALTSGGALDTSWAPAAPVPGDLFIPGAALVSVATDGATVLVAGGPSSGPPPVTKTLTRFTGAGAPDPSFAPGGQVVLPSGFEPDLFPLTVSGGAYYVGGQTASGMELAAAVVKVLATGTIDATFGTGGAAVGPPHPCSPTVRSIFVVANAVYAVTGREDCGAGPVEILRFTPNGVLDPSYGVAGELTIDTIDTRHTLGGASSAMQSTGRIVIPQMVGGDTPDDVATVVFRVRGSSTVGPLPGSFVSLTPARILDTRFGNGAPTGAIAGGGSIDLQVTGRGGVPGSGVGAVVMNVTVTQPSFNGNVVAYPTGAPFPLASNLNFDTGQTIPNLVTVKVGTDGKVTLKNNSTGTVQLVADVAGYYVSGTATEPGTFTPLAPARILDTRFGNGAPMGPIAGTSSIDLQVTGRGGVPASGVGAVVMNVTVTQPSFNGNVVAYPTGAAFPLASNLNFQPGQTIPNLVTVKVGDGGKVTLKNNSTGTVQLVADVAGYYLAGTATEPGTFVPLTPSRILDTRFGNGAPMAPIPGGGSIDLQVSGQGGVPASGAGALVMNLTVTQPALDGNVVAYPTGAAFPLASNLNFVPGQTIPNLVAVKLGTGGKVTLKNNSAGSVQLVADVAGYFNS